MKTLYGKTEKLEIDKLKPCPFCGGQPETWWDNEYYNVGLNIECCIVNIDGIYTDEVIDAWNTRYEKKTKLMKRNFVDIREKCPAAANSLSGALICRITNTICSKIVCPFEYWLND